MTPTKRKLLLVNPKPHRAGFVSNRHSLFPPLGLGVIAKLTPRDRWEIKLIDENFDQFAVDPDTDLVGITAFTSAAPRAYDIARQCAACNIPVVIGGAHASVCPNEVLNYCDAVVVGEVEGVWDLVLADLLRNQLEGIYQVKPGHMATPDRSFFTRYPRDTIQTSRGCPYACDYCSVWLVNGRTYRSRPFDDVMADLDSLHPLFFIVDDNFVGEAPWRRAEVKQILRALITRGDRLLWFCQTSINVAEDAELLDLLYRAGCRMLFIGIETEDGYSALGIKRKRYGECRAAMTEIHRHGLSVLGSFIIGLEDDDEERMQHRVEFIHACGVDAYQVTLMTPLPGTPLFQRAQEQGRLPHTNFPADWGRYDFTDTCYLPRAFDTLEDYRRVVHRCLLGLYSETALEKHAKQTRGVVGNEAAFFAYQSNRGFAAIAQNRLKEERQTK